MSVCPKDMQPCIDDLCYGGGCMQMDGAPMYYRCDCGEYVSDDDYDACRCDDNGDAGWILDHNIGAQ